MEEDEKHRFGNQRAGSVLTKFAPPPYLPGETERRMELLRREDVESSTEQAKGEEEMQQSVYHYY